MRGAAMKAGAKCYTEAGEECFYVAKVADGVVVRPQFDVEEENYDGYRIGNPIVTPRVFAKPPTKIYDDRVAILRSEVETLNARASELRTEISEGERKRREMIGRLSQVPALERIEAILDGKMTHAATIGYGYAKVETLADALKSSEGGRAVRLVSLFGRTNGDLLWEINKYSDGSGSGQEVGLFASEGDARAFVVARIAKELAACEALEADKDYHCGTWARLAREFGVPVPATVSDRVLAKARADLDREAEACRAKLTVIDAKRTALEAAA